MSSEKIGFKLMIIKINGLLEKYCTLRPSDSPPAPLYRALAGLVREGSSVMNLNAFKI